MFTAWILRGGIALAFFSGALLGCGASFAAECAEPTHTTLNTKRGTVEIAACEATRNGDVFTGNGSVQIKYQALTISADHMEFNSATGDANATGNVRFDYNNQHMECDDARYNIQSSRGTFHHVRGEIRLDRRPSSAVLVTPNPLSFSADTVERTGEDTFIFEHAQLTICRPDHPTWKFYAPHANLHVDHSVAMLNANFRMLSIPLLWMPYATAPASSKMRQSGFLIPRAGQSSTKGFVFGDSYYWAPADWLDTTIGGEYMSRRGWSQTGEIRATPTENMSLLGSYFGVTDRGLPDANGVRVPQGGHQFTIEFDDLLPGGWRAVADVNDLSSLTFRLAFAETFGEAVNAEANSAGFLTNNFRGFSLNFGVIDNKDFLSAQPQAEVVIRSAPEARFSSVDQAPWRKLPVYFGFDALAGGVSRSDPNFTTPAIVQRDEFAPRVTVPLNFGPWLGITTTYTVRTTRYGAELLNNVLVGNSLRRTTGELNVDLRPPGFERVWTSGDTKWKHVIEPDISYRYVNGVTDFGDFIRFDQDETLTDTNEIQYGITSRFFRRKGSDGAEEFLTWRVAQKYYFDPTFGGAIVPGQRNVFEALDSITPFAFADTIRHVSPLVSDVTVSPGGAYDLEVLTNYDTQRHKLITQGELLKTHPYSKFTVTMAHFSIRTNPVLQPLTDQVRALVGYGDIAQRGWNLTGGVSYDIQQGALQNQIAQIGYNGSCCGLAFEYRRLALGTVRTENQFRVSLVIANIGTFGNVHRQDKIF